MQLNLKSSLTGHDCYSDIYLKIRIRIHPEDEITPSEYFRHPERFGIDREHCLGMILDEENKIYRVVYKNGMRYDLVFLFEYDTNADKILLLPGVPPEYEKHNFTDRLSNPESSSNPDWPIENVDRFWFVQIQALGKLYRKDYLIADHLANMNLNETLVQQMILRDKKYGTKHHRYGYEDRIAYTDHKYVCPVQRNDELFNMISEKIYRAAFAYDDLLAMFYPDTASRSAEIMKIWEYYENAV